MLIECLVPYFIVTKLYILFDNQKFLCIEKKKLSYIIVILVLWKFSVVYCSCLILPKRDAIML